MTSKPNIKLGVVMDPISAINPKKDSTMAMLLEAQQRGWSLYYMEQNDLFLDNTEAYAMIRPLSVNSSLDNWFESGEAVTQPLSDLDVILMRKDPPFDIDYIYTTYLLEQAEAAGTLVVNKPQSLRDANEKLYTAWFPHCCTPSMVTSQPERIKAFLAEHGDIIVKPLSAMGGASIFRVTEDNPNVNVIIEVMTNNGQTLTMAQRYLPEILQGDKRILLIDGEPIPYALARIPADGETRANLATGGTGVGQPLSERDQWLCKEIGPTLKAKGLTFVGLDVIGDYVTEINVTSPTGIRELDNQFNLNISAKLMDAIEVRLA
ncbi:MAG: glutathione synthase [Gammaproteobacteria bacterium]|nr:glutathione synthase [Gammaproteobacteria bacterium]